MGAVPRRVKATWCYRKTPARLRRLRLIRRWVRRHARIDAAVIAHASDENAWEAPIVVPPYSQSKPNRFARCTDYKPDHNGECLNCDEPGFAHQKENPRRH